MNNAIYNFPLPANEPVLEYKKDSPERKQLESEIQRQLQNPIEIPLIIGGKEVRTSTNRKGSYATQSFSCTSNLFQSIRKRSPNGN